MLAPLVLGLVWGAAAAFAGAWWFALLLVVVGVVGQVLRLSLPRSAPPPRRAGSRPPLPLEGPFRHDYEVEVVDGTPNGLPVIFLPTGRREDARGGTILRVTPRGGTSWLGLFGGFRPGRGRLVAMPHERRFLVHSDEQAYVVPIDSPAATEVLAGRVHGIYAIPGRGLLVVHDLTGFTAYGRDGRVWQSARISWDGLTVTRVTNDAIEGTATDLQDREIPFRLDLATGRHEGGSWPRQDDGAGVKWKARSA